MKILLVEDDRRLGESLQEALQKSGYSTDWIKDGADVDLCLRGHEYALVILDLGLPSIDGITILKKLRQEKNEIPVLILTARDTVADKVQGLDHGADEYMLKPFNLTELEARIRLLLRRKQNHHLPTITVGKLVLNPATNQITCGKNTCALSTKEFALMRILMENPKMIFSRAQLEEKIYGWNEEVESNSLEVHIHQIRKKLGRAVIVNTRGVGYSIGRPA